MDAVEEGKVSTDKPISPCAGSSTTKSAGSKGKVHDTRTKSTPVLLKRECMNKLFDVTQNTKLGNVDGSPLKRRRRYQSKKHARKAKPEVVNLAERRDVVNKTILRGMRRYYSNLFKAKFQSAMSQKDTQSGDYFTNICVFGTERFPSVEDEDLGEISYFMAAIIAPKNLTDSDLEAFTGNMVDLKAFYNCLYKYSHSRLVSLFSIQPLQPIYEDFYRTARTSIFESEPALAKSRELYLSVLSDFQRYFAMNPEDHSEISVT